MTDRIRPVITTIFVCFASLFLLACGSNTAIPTPAPTPIPTPKGINADCADCRVLVPGGTLPPEGQQVILAGCYAGRAVGLGHALSAKLGDRTITEMVLVTGVFVGLEADHECYTVTTRYESMVQACHGLAPICNLGMGENVRVPSFEVAGQITGLSNLEYLTLLHQLETAPPADQDTGR